MSNYAEKAIELLNVSLVTINIANEEENWDDERRGVAAMKMRAMEMFTCVFTGAEPKLDEGTGYSYNGTPKEDLTEDDIIRALDELGDYISLLSMASGKDIALEAAASTLKYATVFAEALAGREINLNPETGFSFA